MNREQHWEAVYRTKQSGEVSWYQPVPGEALRFLKELNITRSSSIIDIGGGDSLLVDHLLKEGYTDITVLDISAAAISRAKKRLGTLSEKVTWITADVLNLDLEKKFDCWHDRATFHFFTTEDEISRYISIARNQLLSSGKLIVGTFSTEGPEKCSGLPVKQYNESNLVEILKKWFEKIKCIHSEHATPFNTIQDFLFCSFKKITY